MSQISTPYTAISLTALYISGVQLHLMELLPPPSLYEVTDLISVSV